MPATTTIQTRLSCVILAVLLTASAPATGLAETPDAEAAWRPRWKELSRRGGGFVVWESNRSGAWRIWHRKLDGSDLRRLTPDEKGRDHFCAHIRPDGKKLVYLSYPSGRKT